MQALLAWSGVPAARTCQSFLLGAVCVMPWLLLGPALLQAARASGRRTEGERLEAACMHAVRGAVAAMVLVVVAMDGRMDGWS